MKAIKPISILHLRSSNFYGGPEKQIHFHAKHAIESGVDLRVASFSENAKAPDFLSKISSDNIPTKLFNVKNAYDKASITLIKKYLRDNKIDIICTHEYRSHFYGFMASRGTPTKWIAFSRGMTTENIKVKIFTYLEKYLLRKADHIVAVSESQKLKLIKQSIKPQNITTVHNAIDIAHIKSIPVISLKDRFRFPNDTYVSISAGRFSQEKGQIYLVKAAEIAIKKNDKLRFVLFGEGPDLLKIQKYIKNKNLDTHILCPGFETNILGLLKSADLLINPSLSEGLPNIVLEALASDIPVIVTNVGGHPEIVTDNKNGYLVEPTNIYQLSDKILSFAENTKSSFNFITESRNILNHKFSFSSQHEKLTNLYKRLSDPSHISSLQ
jgi:glycosyltransferase involved in cell wall biosynthesis